MVLPVPGGPIISTLGAPAAAISSPRLACAWPRTSAKSSPSPSVPAPCLGPTSGCAGAISRSPLRYSTASCSVVMPIASTPATTLASAAFAAGTSSGAEALAPRVQRDREHPAHRAHAAVERQLAHQERAIESARLHEAGGAEDAHRHRQIEGRALLAQVRRRQVHGDPVDRELEPRVADRGPNPVPALAHGRIRESHGCVGRQSRVTSTSTKTVAASIPESVAERTRASTGSVWERGCPPSTSRDGYGAASRSCSGWRGCS